MEINNVKITFILGWWTARVHVGHGCTWGTWVWHEQSDVNWTGKRDCSFCSQPTSMKGHSWSIGQSPGSSQHNHMVMTDVPLSLPLWGERLPPDPTNSADPLINTGRPKPQRAPLAESRASRKRSFWQRANLTVIKYAALLKTGSGRWQI